MGGPGSGRRRGAHTFAGKRCACGRIHKVTEIPKARGTPRPRQPPMHRVVETEDLAAMALLRALARPYQRWHASRFEDQEAFDEFMAAQDLLLVVPLDD